MAKAKAKPAAKSKAKSTATTKPVGKPATKQPAPKKQTSAKPKPAAKQRTKQATPKPAATKQKPAPAKRAPTLAELHDAITKAAGAKQLDKVAKLTRHAATRATAEADRRELQQVLQRCGNRALWAQHWTDAAAIYDAGIAVGSETDAGDASQVTAEMLAECGFALLQVHQLDEAEARIRRALALHDAAERPESAANAVYYLSSVIFERGQIDRAVELAREAVKRSTDAADTRGATFHAYSLARGLYEQGHSREAEEVSKTAVAQAKTLGLPAVEGNFENMIANVALDDHRLDDGRRHYERALELFEQAGLKMHQAITTSNLGNLAWDADRLDDALQLYAKSIKLQKKSKDARAIAIAVTARAGVLTELGRFAEAQQDLETALATMTQRGHERRVSFVRAAFARLAEARGELEEARAHYAEAEMSLEAAGDTVEIGRMLYAAAGVEADLGDPESAEALIVRAAALDPASLSPDKTGVGEKRAGMHAVRALRELALARIEVARSKRLEGDDASALRRAATARMQAITSGRSSLMASSCEVRRVVTLLAAQLGAPVLPATRFAGTSRGTGWETELTGELWISTDGGELVATGSLAWDDRTAQLEARGRNLPGIRRLRGTLVASAYPAATWQVRLEVEVAETVLRGRLFEVLEEGGEDEICALDWRLAVPS